MNRWIGKSSSALTLAMFLSAWGCHGATRGGLPVPPEKATVDNAAPARIEWAAPAVPIPEPGTGKEAGAPPEEKAARPAVETVPRDNVVAVPAPSAGGTIPDNGIVLPRADSAAPGSAGAEIPAQVRRGEPPPPPSAEAAGRKANHGSAPATARRTKTEAPRPVEAASQKELPDAAAPAWAASREELVYRVDFIGITMGYARFRFQGKVSIGDRIAYHLNVRAWTSGALSFIYPINDTIDYYLDVETLAPIRQDFFHAEREKDDVALYDQKTGTITYRFRHSGKIRKQVETVPMVYDPVSVAYYYRWRDLGAEDRPRNVYGGRKVYQISSRVLGNERIRTERGEIDTIAVQPVIRRDGKPDNKGDLKIWFSGDARRVPVRLYAKFHKIKDWTLVGELMPAQPGG